MGSCGPAGGSRILGESRHGGASVGGASSNRAAQQALREVKPCRLCAPERTTGNRSRLRALTLMLGCWLRFQRLDYETCVNGTTYRTFVPNASQSHSASTVCCDVCAAVRGLARPRPLATGVGNKIHPAHHCRASVAVWTSHCEA